jgi:hypothetical protein
MFLILLPFFSPYQLKILKRLSQTPPSDINLRAEGLRVPDGSHNLARQLFPRAAPSQCATFFAHHGTLRAHGAAQSRARAFGAGVHGDIRDSNPRHGPGKSGLEGGPSRSSRRRTGSKTGILGPSSTFAIARAVRDGVQANLRVI